MHLHWGTAISGGSEHTVNKEQTFAEIHFVHFNTKYGTLGNAVTKSDGLAVLGVMVQVNCEASLCNKHYNMLITINC